MDVNNTTNIGKVKIIMLKGEAGNSIASIEKTSTTDTHEIYTITLTDGTTQQISIAKGNGIVSIEKTATVGLVDTYTITFTDDTTTTFDVINGQSYTVPQGGIFYFEGNTIPEGYEETDDIYSAEIRELMNDVNVLGARVDEIIALPDGSTTADAELVDIRVGADGITYSSAGKAVRKQINSLVTGEPNKIYDFDDFITDFSSWYGYNAEDMTITNSAVTIGDSTQHFIYKRAFFNYIENSNISVSIKIRIDNYVGGDYGQQLRILASGYSSSNISKDISVNNAGTTVVYNGVNYNIGDIIEVKFDFENVAINSNAYISFNNRNNTNVNPLEFSIVGFDVFYSESGIVSVQYAKELVSHLKDKTWGAVGDSLTASYFDVYVSYVANALGLVATNYGVGGSTIAQVEGRTDSIVERICGLNGNTAYPDNYDLWTIFGGINDSFSNVPIGTITDNTATTFYGALNLICQHLLTLDSHPTVAFICPWNAKNTAEEGYVTAIVNIAHKYGLPVLNLYEVSGINSQNWNYYIRDSVHPNQNGVNKIRPIILEWFERLRISETTPNMPN